MTCERFPPPSRLGGVGGEGHSVSAWRPPLVHPVPRGAGGRCRPRQGGLAVGVGVPCPHRHPPRAPRPCVGCFDSVPEPSSGKPRRTGRHSSFYRPSNWGWSRRGNTKILYTQLLSVRARLQQREAREARGGLYC